MVKINSSGAKQWDARFGGSSYDELRSLLQTSDGGYILGGYSASGISGDKTAGGWGDDFWLVKINSSGVKQWDACFGGTSSDGLRSLRQTVDGGYILGGYSNSGISGVKTQASQGGTDYWMVKITSGGVKQWDVRFGGSGIEYPNAIGQTTDGGYIIGGYSASGISGDKTQASWGSNDFWVVKISPYCLPSGTPCNDGHACTSGEMENGNCQCLGSPNNALCDDCLPSTTDVCNPVSGCLNTTGGPTHAPTKQWDFRFGGSAWDEMRSIQQTSDGGYILGGQSGSGISGDKTQASQGYTDYWVVKTNSSGVKQWDARFGGNDADYFRALQQTNDGGYILGGWSRSPISGDKTQASWGVNDFWVVKLDGSGVKQWDKRFGGTAFDELMALQQTSDGGYILGGISNSPASGDKSQGTTSGGSDFDYWVVKINSTGLKLWDARFGGASDEYTLSSIQQTSDGGYILGGESSSGISGNKTQASWGGSDYWVVKINSSGVKQWDARFGGAGLERLRTVRQTTDGGYILGGYSSSTISGDKTQYKASDDYWLVKINSSGVKQWDAALGGTSGGAFGPQDFLFSLQQTCEGGYILGGGSPCAISGDKTQASQGGFDYWVVKTNSNGVKQWDVTFGGSAEDTLYSLHQTTDGWFILGGTSASGISGDKTQASQGSRDFWAVKMGCPAAGIACNDNDACTTGDVEDGNCNCVGTPVTCDDGLFCTGTETCAPATGCVAGTAPNDASACTVDSCNEANDTMIYTPVVCDDGLFCNGAETCNPATGCVAGNPGINDGIACTVDACDEANDIITHTPSNALCNDGLFCTGTETCTPPTGCVTSPAPIDDAIDCTVDVCDEANDLITHTPNNAVCDDCNPATTDICSPTTGCAPYVSPVTPVKQWDVRFGGSSTDRLFSIQQTTDGGYMLGGYSNSGISGDKTQTTWGSTDFWMVKTDSSGVKQWDKRFGGSSSDDLTCLRQTTDGGYILGGYSNSGISGDKTEASRGGYDYWVVKTDASGLKQWDKRFGGSSNEYIYSLQQTNDGGYILGGYSFSGISGDKTQASQGLEDIWVVKIDASGNKQWDARFGGSSNEDFKSLQQTTDGGYILGGWSNSGISGDKTQASQGGYDYWVVKIDGGGVKQWDKRFGGSGTDIIYSVQQITDGGYVLGGYSTSGISGDRTEASRGAYDYWIVKLDGIGVKQWDKRFGGSSNDYLYALDQTGDGGFILGGYSFSGISGDKTQTSQGAEDFWVVKTAACGAKQWDARYGGSSTENLNALIRTSDGAYTLGGYSASGISGDKTQASRGGDDFWIVKMQACPVAGTPCDDGLDCTTNDVESGSCNCSGTVTVCGTIQGNVFNDLNSNCSFDGSDVWQKNIKVQLWNSDTLVQQTFTNSDGFYSFNVDTAFDYEVTVDTSVIPFAVSCPDSNVHHTIFSGGYVDDDNDFALECNQGFDIAVWSISGSNFRPGSTNTIKISAGDLAKFSGTSCAAGASGVVTIVVSGPATYTSPASGAITPTSVSGNTLTWNVANFGIVDFYTAFNFIVNTSTTAQIGSAVSVTASITSSGDNNPLNNSLTFSFPVMNSFDPNDKLSYPPTNIDPSQEWITYTIRFQNTGTADALDIYIEDTLDANLDESTFQLLEYSHEPEVQVKGKIVRFDFPDINLPDSNTNEPASHGYVQFKVKLMAGLSLSTQISNTGHIYFDYNPPVTTNTVTNTIATSGISWTGGAGNSNWFASGNWSNAAVPGTTENVSVPAVASNIYPVLSGTTNIEINNLTIESGASFTLSPSMTGGIPQAGLIVNGTITNYGNPDMGTGYLTIKGTSIAGNLNVGYLKIDNASGVSLASGATVGVKNQLDLKSGNFNVSAGTLTIESDAPSTGFINDWGSNSGTITGNITVERYVPPGVVSSFHYIGSACGGSTVGIWNDDFANTANAPDGTPVTPTVDCSPTALDPGSAYGSVFTYDESLVTDCYLSGWRVNTTSHSANRGYGFAAIVTGGTVLDETCSYANTNVNLSNLSITAANSVPYSKGYHLVANPFCAPIDWSAMATINNGLGNNMDATAYIYNPNSGTYGPYNLITGGYITTNMGFFVRHVPSYTGSSYNVRFDATTRTTLNNDAFLRQIQPYEYAMTITAGNGTYSDQTLIAFDENFTDGYDNGYDAGKLQSSYGIPTLYTRDTSDERMAIQAVGINASVKTIPLGLNVRGASGNYTFTFDGIQNFPATENIWLEDLQLDSIQYLRQTGTYSFNAAETDNPDRFIIHFMDESISISGNVTTESGSGISTVKLTASGTSAATDSTDVTGSYSLDFRVGDSIGVTPSKGDDVITYNSISTLDILLIRRHILNVAPLTSPYKIIAADVNSSNTVTTQDILQMRTVILQISATFPDGKLWAFTPDDYVFANPQEPFPFPSSRSYGSLSTDLAGQDFIGIKLGDVNGDWDPNTPKQGAIGNVQMAIDEYQAMPGDEIIVPVRAKDFKNVIGYQFTLSWNAEVLEFLSVTNHAIEGHYGTMKTSEGFLTTSWSDALTKNITLRDNEVVFELRFKVRGETGRFSPIKIGSEMTRSEAYNGNLDLLNVVPANGMVKVGATEIYNLKSTIYNLKVLPNPFTNNAQITFDLAQDEAVTLSIYDIFGKQVKLLKGDFKSGKHQLEWAGDDDAGNLLSSGLYHVRMTAGDETEAVKVELMRR